MYGGKDPDEDEYDGSYGSGNNIPSYEDLYDQKLRENQKLRSENHELKKTIEELKEKVRKLEDYYESL